MRVSNGQRSVVKSLILARKVCLRVYFTRPTRAIYIFECFPPFIILVARVGTVFLVASFATATVIVSHYI